MNKTCLPLEGVKVLELATVVATPVAARMLADYGAEVIKIESPPYGDTCRTLGKDHQLPIEDGNNPFFDQLNTGKKFVALNLKTKEGMDAFFKLLGEVDIFMTNVRIKSLEKLGIDYETIKDQFPQLIYAHFTGLGTWGQEANRPSFDQTAFWTRSGAATESLAKGSVPAKMSFAFGDIVSSNMFIDGILMAYIGRQKHGKGTLICTSLLKSAIWCNTTSVINAQPQYGKEYPVHRYKPNNPFTEFYRCQDGEWIGFFDRDYEHNREYFAEILDMPILLEDPDLFSIKRMQDSGKVSMITVALEEAFAKKPSKEWEHLLRYRDIACEIAMHYKDLHRDPQAIANRWYEGVEYEEGITTYMPTPPVDFSEFGRKKMVRTGPVGCDTEEVLASIGYTEEQLEAMRENKAIM
ncbi:MAG: CoA transferase [Clostridiales bacterium]|nr:CoA transferase [Candidatus Crickella merdequi]